MAHLVIVFCNHVAGEGEWTIGEKNEGEKREHLFVWARGGDKTDRWKDSHVVYGSI